MASVGPDDGGTGSPSGQAPRLVGDMWLDAEEDPTADTQSNSSASDTLAPIRDMNSDGVATTSLRDGPHRRNRLDTLESLDGFDHGEGRGHRRARSGLKTYEQLRSLHPERGHPDGEYEYSLEQRGGLVKSITSDIKIYYRKLSRSAAQKLQRRRERGCLPSFDWRKSFEALPVVMTARSYQKEFFASDLAAGLTEGIVCIPMGMSYALLANLPPVYGLYTGVIPPLMYLMFGTCEQISLGVSAIESLLVGEGVSGVIGWINDEVDATTTQEDIDAKIQVTLAFTLCVGIWQIIMRIFGIGAIATFLSDPVLSGFSTASAFLIGTSQLKHLVGYELPKAILPVIWIEAVSNVHHFNITSLCIGVTGILALMLFKKLNQRYLPDLPLPSQVVVVILATLAVYVFSFDEAPHNVKILGHIPDGLPPPAFPTFPNVEGVGGLSSYGGNLAIQSLLVAVMTYIITISIGKTFQRINDNAYKIDGGQELVAMASANVVGSLFQTYPASGSLSRTAVVQSVGAKTRMHLVPAVLVVMLVLVAITPLLYTLPNAILASVVMFGVVKMVDFRDAKRLYHLSKPDFFLWNVSFWVTAIVGPIEGIGVSIVVSLLYLLMQTSRPANSILGRLPETREYRNVKRFPMAKEIPGIRIFRFDSSLHFANKDYFENRLKALENDPCEGVRIHTIVLDASSINQLDASAIDMLILVAKSYDERGVSILCANWKGPQRDLLELSGFYDVIPPANLFLGLHDAVVEARKRSRDITSEPLPAPAPRSPTTTASRNTTNTDGGAVASSAGAGDPPSSVVGGGGVCRESSVAETVVEIGPDGETREWRVGAVEMNPSGEMEREWGMGRV